MGLNVLPFPKSVCSCILGCSLLYACILHCVLAVNLSESHCVTLDDTFFLIVRTYISYDIVKRLAIILSWKYSENYKGNNHVTNGIKVSDLWRKMEMTVDKLVLKVCRLTTESTVHQQVQLFKGIINHCHRHLLALRVTQVIFTCC